MGTKKNRSSARFLRRCIAVKRSAMMRYLERAMGIEPTALAWEARVLPLYDARVACDSTRDFLGSASQGMWC